MALPKQAGIFSFLFDAQPGFPTPSCDADRTVAQDGVFRHHGLRPKLSDARIPLPPEPL
jgi:hypothetical protein